MEYFDEDFLNELPGWFGTTFTWDDIIESYKWTDTYNFINSLPIKGDDHHGRF